MKEADMSGQRLDFGNYKVHEAVMLILLAQEELDRADDEERRAARIEQAEAVAGNKLPKLGTPEEARENARRHRAEADRLVGEADRLEDGSR